MAAKKTRNPMLTKTGKPKLKPLNINQLNELLEKSNKPKEKAVIKKRIVALNKRGS